MVVTSRFPFRSFLAAVGIVFVSLFRPSYYVQGRRASGDTEDVYNSRPTDTGYREATYPSGNPVAGTYHPNRRTSASSSRPDDEDYSYGSPYGSSYSSRRTTTRYASSGNSRSGWNDDYDDSYIPASTKTPRGSSGGIFQSIKDLLSHSSSGSGTSSSKYQPSSGYDDYSERSVEHREEGSSKSGLGDAFSKYGKYLIPALTMAGKHLPKLLGKKFGSSNKDVTDNTNPQTQGSHPETYSPSQSDEFRTAVNRPTGQWSNGKRVVPIGTPIIPTPSPVAESYQVPTRIWKTFTPWKTRNDVEREAATLPPVTTVADKTELENEEACNLVRWNREVPFTELPSMIIAFLANNSASGTTIVKKANALRGLLDRTEETFNSEEVLDTEPAFAVPAGLTWQTCFHREFNTASADRPRAPLSTRCLMAQRLKANWPECMPVSSTTAATITSRTREPMLASLDRLRSIYLSNAEDGQLDLDDLVQASAACTNPKDDKLVRTRLANCLDYSLHAEQVINANVTGSVFGKEEICSRFLSFDVARCAGLVPRNAPADLKPTACQVDQLLIISAFARNFYSCHYEIDPTTVAQLQQARKGKTVITPQG